MRLTLRLEGVCETLASSLQYGQPNAYLRAIPDGLRDDSETLWKLTGNKAAHRQGRNKGGRTTRKQYLLSMMMMQLGICGEHLSRDLLAP